jgi:hypothetical protein
MMLDMGRSDVSFYYQRPAPQTYKRAFRAWWIKQCEKWFELNVNEEASSAPASAIRFLCQLFDNEALSTFPTEDFKEVMALLLLTQRAWTSHHDTDGKEATKFALGIRSRAYKRGLFKTQHNFVGMGTLSTQVSDQVWLIRDSLVPLILRPVGDTGTFVLVGEAYLHGFMHGEMLDPRWRMENRTVVIV